ncbi:MAG: hypothetical protein IJ805_01645 [Lachnospiraceae bacterium]|nr:hypothetical protein [Lachnospiraceae bacterium]
MYDTQKAVQYDEVQFELMMQLGDYVRQGIPIFFDNVPSTPYDVVNNLAVKEDEVYMADFVRDDRGNLTQIRYNHVS